MQQSPTELIPLTKAKGSHSHRLLTCLPKFNESSRFFNSDLRGFAALDRGVGGKEGIYSVVGGGLPGRWGGGGFFEKRKDK